MRQVNPPRSAIFDGFNGFKRSRTFWISKGHSLCVYKAFGRHTCSPGSVPAGTGISPVPTGTLPGGPRGPLEAIQTRRLCRVDDLGAWVCPDSTKWPRMTRCGACEEMCFFMDLSCAKWHHFRPFCRIWTNPSAQVMYMRCSTRFRRLLILLGVPRGSPDQDRGSPDPSWTFPGGPPGVSRGVGNA